VEDKVEENRGNRSEGGGTSSIRGKKVNKKMKKKRHGK
jgi:hypothetical protein